MRILLTGAAGNLGRQILKRFDPDRHEILPFTHPEMDVTKAGAVQEAVASFKPDIILNAAAFNDVDGAESRPEAAYAANEAGPRNLARAAAETGAAILHVSTDYVFDGEKETPYDENDAPNPLSTYAKSKLAGEEGVREANQRSYIVRTAWVYAPDGNNFPNTLLKLAAKQDTLRVVSDVKGSPTFAGDLARKIEELIDSNVFGTYHLAGAGEGASWFDLANVFFKEMGMDQKILPVPSSEFPRPAKRPKYSVLRTIQTPQILLPPWQEGVAEFAHALRHPQEK